MLVVTQVHDNKAGDITQTTKYHQQPNIIRPSTQETLTLSINPNPSQGRADSHLTSSMMGLETPSPWVLMARHE